MPIHNPLHSFVLLSFAVLAACTGGQGGDPGTATGGTGAIGDDAGGTGGTGGDSGTDMGIDDCIGERWDDIDAPLLSGSCSRIEPDLFVCECSESQGADRSDTTREVRTESCARALLDACAVDLMKPRHCSANAIGTCFPTDTEETWSCVCEGEAAIEVEAATCNAALTDRCAERCESVFGGCQQALAQADAFGCRCASDDASTSAQPAIGYESCEEALSERCGEVCSSAAGECAFDGEDAFECTCTDGAAVAVPFGATPAVCGESLASACGEVIEPELSGCESSHDGHEVRCDALPMIVAAGDSAEAQWSFECTCDDEAPETLEALTCYRALQTTCSDAIPPSAVVAAAGELGALCETASDCDLGTCFVPGGQHDPVCSAICESDDDCPSDALCGFIGVEDGYEGYCFATCESDVECGLRNDAQHNSLACQERSSFDGENQLGDGERGICVQRSEP